jgi:UDP-GlcNAc:undecaprenyl-phosphate/decaprenyl-phosphate GlcNAc-1-phosphate transferase
MSVAGWPGATIAAAAAVVTVLVLAALPSGLRARLTVPNHRGTAVPAVLGPALFVGGGAAFVGGALWAVEGGEGMRTAWAILAGLALVLVAGLVDDVRGGGGPRGLRGHAAAVGAGRPSTGLLKAVAAVAAGGLIVLVHDRGPVVDLLGVVCIAGFANVWNALDVRPGRSLKGFLVMAVVLIAFHLDPLVLAFGGAAAAALWPDLRERAMLGDAGAYVLGLAAGADLYLRLPGWGVGVAAGVAVALNLLAETVALSRIIRGFPPLRWFDDLGRIRPTEPSRSHEPRV